MKDAVASLRERAQARLAQVRDSRALEELRVQLLGRKGELTALLKKLQELPPAERPRAGAELNRCKAELEGEIERRAAELREEGVRLALARERLDVSLPGRGAAAGRPHLLTQVMERVCAIFERLGFGVEVGPEVEDDAHNFASLNFPADHPARDMQDTFYVEGGWLLRTHTSPVQVRTMERRVPPIKIIAPGKVFRHDADVSHSPVFHQVEGLLVDEGVSFADLKGALAHFLQQLFGEQVRIRWRASFFPFTEPSAEVDIGCPFCAGAGCRICKQSGWLEILGAGMVDPNVFRAAGVDAERYTGYAFGMGIERIAMLLHRVDDIRLFYENDLRFLRQF